MATEKISQFSAKAIADVDSQDFLAGADEQLSDNFKLAVEDLLHTGSNLGSGVGVYASTTSQTQHNFKSLVSSSTKFTITSNANEIKFDIPNPWDLSDGNDITGVLPLLHGGTGTALTTPVVASVFLYNPVTGNTEWRELGDNLTDGGDAIDATDTNTTYTAGDGIDITAGVISVDTTPGTPGRVAGASTEITIVAGTGLTGGGTVNLGDGGTVTLNATSSSTERFTTVSADSGSIIAQIEEDSFSILGGEGISTSVSGNEITINATSDIYTAGDGIHIAGNIISLSKLGIEDLLAPSGDRLYFFDSSENKTDWLTLGEGFNIVNGELTVNHHANSITAGVGININNDTVSLKHLGLENLSDPNVNSFYFWDENLNTSVFMKMSNDFTISNGILYVNGNLPQGNNTVLVSGTTNEIEVTGSSQTLINNPTFQVGLPDNVTIGNNLTVTNKITLGSAAASATERTALLWDVTGDVVSRELDTLAFGGAVPESRSITLSGTTNTIQINGSTGSTTFDLSQNRTFTIDITDDLYIFDDLDVGGTAYIHDVVGSVIVNKGLFLADNDEVVYRTLGSNAFTSDAYVPETRSLTHQPTVSNNIVITPSYTQTLTADRTWNYDLANDISVGTIVTTGNVDVGGSLSIGTVPASSGVSTVLTVDPSGNVGYTTIDTNVVNPGGGSGVPSNSRTLTHEADDANIVVSTPNAQDLSADRTWGYKLADNITTVGNVTVGGSLNITTIPSDTNELSVILTTPGGDVVQNDLDPAAFEPGLYDTGWVNVPTYSGGSGWAQPTTNHPNYPQYRVIGRLVLLRGEYIVPLSDGSSEITNWFSHAGTTSAQVYTSGNGVGFTADKNVEFPLIWSDAKLKPDRDMQFRDAPGFRFIQSNGTNSTAIKLQTIVNVGIQSSVDGGSEERFIIQCTRDQEIMDASGQTNQGMNSNEWVRSSLLRHVTTVAKAGERVLGFANAIGSSGTNNYPLIDSAVTYRTSFSADGNTLNAVYDGSMNVTYPFDFDGTDGQYFGGLRIRLDGMYFTLSNAHTLAEIHALL